MATHSNNVCAGRLRRGFTLVETLVALLILVIMTGIVAMGIPVAFDTYTKAVDGSNAQVLLSTSTAELRNEFGLAQDCQVKDGTVYYVTGEGYWACLQSTDDGIKKYLFTGDQPGEINEDTPSVLLVSRAAQTDALRVKFDSIAYANGVFTVNGLKVVRANDESTVLAAVGENASGQYKVRAIMLGEGR